MDFIVEFFGNIFQLEALMKDVHGEEMHFPNSISSLDRIAEEQSVAENKCSGFLPLPKDMMED